MDTLFNQVVSMSVTASIVILAVLVIRILLKKLSRRITCLLWVIVAIRLIVPFAPESKFSLLPREAVLNKSPVYLREELNEPQDYQITQTQVIVHTTEQLSREEVKPVEHSRVSKSNTNPLALIWVSGIAAMSICGVVSSIRLKRRVATNIQIQYRVFKCDDISAPFVLGLFKPCIYIPSSIGENDYEYIVAHEMAHISRKDYIWKLLAYVMVSIHWFNPLVWLSFVLFARDIELASDEKVISSKNGEYKKAYANALLSCATHKKVVFSYNLYFGEIGIKERIMAVKKYKKSAISVGIVAIIICALVAGCLLTDPETNVTDESNNTTSEISEETSVEETSVAESIYASSTIVSDSEDSSEYMWMADSSSYVFDDLVFETEDCTVTPLSYTYDGYVLNITYDVQEAEITSVYLVEEGACRASYQSVSSFVADTDGTRDRIRTATLYFESYLSDFNLEFRIGDFIDGEVFTIPISLTNNSSVEYLTDIDVSNIWGENSRITGIGLSESLLVLNIDTTRSIRENYESISVQYIDSNGIEVNAISNDINITNASTEDDLYAVCTIAYSDLVDINMSEVTTIIITIDETGESIQFDL